jgi:hypothetical protein
VKETYNRLDARSSSKAVSATPTSTAITGIIRLLLERSGPISYFALHKVFYLIEYEHFRRFGTRLTRAYIVRQKDGPYAVDLNIRKIKKALPELQTYGVDDKIVVGLPESHLPFENGSATRTDFGADVGTLIGDVVGRYAGHTDEQLKRAVYLTSPMRQILRREKYGHENMFNCPIDFRATPT